MNKQLRKLLWGTGVEARLVAADFMDDNGIPTVKLDGDEYTADELRLAARVSLAVIKVVREMPQVPFIHFTPWGEIKVMRWGRKRYKVVVEVYGKMMSEKAVFEVARKNDDKYMERKAWGMSPRPTFKPPKGD